MSVVATVTSPPLVSHYDYIIERAFGTTMSSSDSESTSTSPSATPFQSGPTEEQLDRLAETLTEAAEQWPESRSQDQSSVRHLSPLILTPAL